jgi:hypothetical protein
MVELHIPEVDAKLAPVPWGHEIVQADRSSEAGQILIKPFFEKPKVRT